MTKRFFLLATLLVVLILVAACGGAATPTPEAAPATEAAAPAATEEAAAPATEAPATEEAAAPATEAPAATEEAAAPAEGGAKKYGQVTDVGGIDDRGFNQLAWVGLQNAGKDFGLEVQFLESQQQTDYEKNIGEFLGQGYNGIITVGFLLADATKVASEANPDVPFAIVDFPSQTSGDMGLLFAVEEPSFLAGYLAAAMSETGTVCTYGGIKIPPVVAFMVGFEHGVMYYNEKNGAEVQVLGWKTDPAAEGGGDGSFTGNFESLDDGRSFAENFFDEGCDIIFPVAGPVGLGSATAAQDRGFKVIGVDADLTQTNPDAKEVYLTSVLKKIDVAVYEAVKRMNDGTFEGGTNYISTTANGGVGLAPFYDYDDDVPQEVKDALAEIEKGLIDGSIKTGWPVEAAPAAEGTAEAEGGEAMAAPAAGELGSAEKPINVLFVPSVDAGVIVTGGEVMAEALNQATGLSFKVDVPTSYAATVEAMCASPENTIGFIPALGYVLANNNCGVEVGAAAVRRGLSWYTTQFLVQRDSDIKTIEDLAGKKWAVPDLGSTSGYLYPSVMLTEAGVEPGEIVEAGGHPQAVLAVYNGDVDFATSFFSPPLMDPRWEYGDDPEPFDPAAVTRDAEGNCTAGDIVVLDARCAAAETAPDVFEKVRILSLSQQIPNDTMSFSPEFPEELRQQIIDAMVAFAGSEECAQSICNEDFYGWTGMEPVEDSFYDPVRSLISTLGYTEEDIFK
ncbi:MAG: phosphate/phosphite/phosphonate ABC transporter substrate-binding protein [Anaerolineales bacterium]|nr:phosphate/phosphite/phosphonate ABC transporter substrate-binding protein [Anaerolineales bacterium]